MKKMDQGCEAIQNASRLHAQFQSTVFMLAPALVLHLTGTLMFSAWMSSFELN